MNKAVKIFYSAVKCISFLAVFMALIACENDSMTDPRDGKTYKTVKIGEQVWMADNLDYWTPNSKSYENCTDFRYRQCNSDKEDCSKKNCQLYDWNTANHVCPVGWHLPNMEEFKLLLKSVGEISYHGANVLSKNGFANVLSKMGYANLRSKGFTIPSQKDYDMPFALWSSEEDEEDDRFVWVLTSGAGDIKIGERIIKDSKDDAYLTTDSRRRKKNPVHCIKDDKK